VDCTKLVAGHAPRAARRRRILEDSRSASTPRRVWDATPGAAAQACPLWLFFRRCSQTLSYASWTSRKTFSATS
jgi:hypothetical protein